jgi:regulator of sigma E protease
VGALSRTFTDIAVVVVSLGFMIFIHELGHFLAAKWSGVRVLTFSFGFGKRLFGVKAGQFSFGRPPLMVSAGDVPDDRTDYRISLLPLGGYVKMAGEDPSEGSTGDPGEFRSHPRWQRFFIVLMGPAMNVLLAIFLLTVLDRYHYEVPLFETQPALVGEIEPNSPAAQAGFKPGDLLTRVGDEQNPDWEEVELKVAMSPGGTLSVEFVRDGRTSQSAITPRAEGAERLGVAGWTPCVTPQIDLVEEGSPAAKAGVQRGDRILAFAGKAIPCWQDLPPALQASQGTPAELTVQRGETSVKMSLAPIMGDVNGRSQWRIGVGLREVVVRQLSWPKAVSSSIDENIKNCQLSFEAVGKILTRQMSPRSLSGPIGIAQMSGEAYRSGITDLVRVTADISLSLGIFNLLPIPILDGGVFFMLLIESIIRRDLSLAVKERIVQVGLALLLLLTVFVMYNDLVKTFKPY